MARSNTPGKPMITLALGMTLALGLAGLRLIHLGADTPPALSSSAGPYVDEGYKTLPPRNLILFGTTNWEPDDVYVGWVDSSPITQWSYYAAFHLLGVRVEAARVVTIVFFALLLAAFAGTMSGRYAPGLLLGGLLLLGLEQVIFFFSRIALFEIPIAALLYGALFAIARWGANRQLLSLLAMTGVSLVLVFGVKLTALIYLVPVLLAMALLVALRDDIRRCLLDWRLAGVLGLVVGVAIVLTQPQWGPILDTVDSRLDLTFSDYIERVLVNPMGRGAPAVVLGGILCALHGSFSQPRVFLGDLYRCSLVALVLVGIPLVALFEYDPLRYYVPLLPAYVLLVLEWIHLRGWTFGGSPAVGRAVATLLLLFLSVFTVQNVRTLGSFYAAPVYEARKISSDLARLLPPASIVGGVWAPFLTLGTELRSLYVAAVANQAEAVPDLGADYVLYTVANRNSETMMRVIRGIRGVELGPPLYEGTYNRKTVLLHRLEYQWRAYPSVRRGRLAVGRDLVRAGDLERAERLLRQALEEREAEEPVDPLRIAEARGGLGDCLTRLGRFEEAEPLLLEARDAYRPEGATPALALHVQALERLIALYESWGRPDQAEELREQLDRS